MKYEVEISSGFYQGWGSSREHIQMKGNYIVNIIDRSKKSICILWDNKRIFVPNQKLRIIRKVEDNIDSVIIPNKINRL